MATGVFRRRWQPPPQRGGFAPGAQTQVDRTVSTTPATWTWTANAATVGRGREVSTTPATWTWTANAAGIPRNVFTTPATWQWTALAAEINPTDEVVGGGIGKGRGKGRGACKYPRRVMIDGKLYRVCSAEEERQLVQQWRQALEERAQALEARKTVPKTEVRKIRAKVARAERRLVAVDRREEEWLERLREDDDIILAAVIH